MIALKFYVIFRLYISTEVREAPLESVDELNGGRGVSVDEIDNDIEVIAPRNLRSGRTTIRGMKTTIYNRMDLY